MVVIGSNSFFKWDVSYKAKGAAKGWISKPSREPMTNSKMYRSYRPKTDLERSMMNN